MSDKNNNHSNSGIGVLGLLQVAFIVLKVVNLIDWSWWMVFIPTYIWLGVILLILLGIAIAILIQCVRVSMKEKKNV